VKLDNIEVPHTNLLVAKILLGDKSDNVFGVTNFGEKTLVKFFPEVLEVQTSIDDILSKAKQIHSKKKSKALENLLQGISKQETGGVDFFIKRKLIMDLQNPMITVDAKELVEEHIRENIDPEGRSYKNVIRMMTQDGFFKYLPKSDEGFVEFLRPFMKLTRKEKRKFNRQQTN
jgi:5'-3' exonuclease